MSPRRADSTRELLRLYSLAASGEYNLAQFLSEHPELVARLGVPVDLSRDDADVALQLARGIGRHKRKTAHSKAGERAERACAAARQLVDTSRRCIDRVELDADLVFGALLADASKTYIAFELPGSRVPVLRGALVRARAPLRNFIDVAAYVDEQGLHLRWRGGHGGLNFRPQVQERGADVLDVDLRLTPPRRRQLPRPILLADVLANLGLT